MAQNSVDYPTSDWEITNVRDDSDFARAYGHSRNVKVLKLGLPVVAVFAHWCIRHLRHQHNTAVEQFHR